MMKFSEIATANYTALTDELAEHNQNWKQHRTTNDARRHVARLINLLGDLRLYDSETGNLITSYVTDEQAEESCLTPEGHILVDTRNDEELQDGSDEDFRRVYVAE